MTILKVTCMDCDGDGVVECATCEGSGNCICRSCDAEHECGHCEGRGYYDCEQCKGKGLVIYTGQPLPGYTVSEEAVCECGRPAVAIIGKDEVCALCEASRVIQADKKRVMA